MTITATMRHVRARAPMRALAVALAATAADVAFDPEHRHVPMCPFHAVTGWQCPLCGGLRCADALVHGQFGAAVHDNVLVVAAVPVLATCWLLWLVTGRRPPKATRARVAALVVLAVCFTVVRNLPVMAALRPLPS